VVATGGVATGGMATGGRATGGMAAGGRATGGDSSTGGRTGRNTGGAPPTGGASSSGAAGEAATGGSAGAGGGSAGAGGGGTGDPTMSEGCGSPAAAENGNGQSINVGGSNRTYNLRIPDDYDMNHPYRLMISYHWMGGTANNVSPNYYDLWNLSEGSTIFVAPQGNNNAWSNPGGEDVEFSRALIEQLESQLCIDKSRIFCEGFSMGGSMSYAMASAMPETIRAVAVHSGGSMSGTTRGHDGPVAYFMTHGTQDSVCTYPGYGVPQLQDFAGVNGCTQPDPSLSANAFEAALPEPNSSAGACVSFEGCQEGYPVRACLFVGDHTASPGGNWVPGETWDFISQF
jgi:poly(3-hydroxybutyrate) depolymerase